MENWWIVYIIISIIVAILSYLKLTYTNLYTSNIEDQGCIIMFVSILGGLCWPILFILILLGYLNKIVVDLLKKHTKPSLAELFDKYLESLGYK
jgi:hypothetical protein